MWKKLFHQLPADITYRITILFVGCELLASGTEPYEMKLFVVTPILVKVIPSYFVMITLIRLHLFLGAWYCRQVSDRDPPAILRSTKRSQYIYICIFCIHVRYQNNNSSAFNTVRPSDGILRHRSGSTLAQIMACCLTAQSHYPNQCWLIINKV